MAATYTGKHKQNKRTQPSMPRVEFETTIPEFQQAKTDHAFGRAATVIGFLMIRIYIITAFLDLDSYHVNIVL
jgi:hypothetical protein